MILYLDCASGISGDMLVAALLGVAGASADQAGPLDQVVRPALAAAGIDKRLVSLRGVERGGVAALAFRVPEGPGFATFDELIVSMYASKLDQVVADDVARLAERMAAAEREVHGEGVEHLDELGGIDTAVDLISAVALVHHLRPERVVAAPPALGSGTVETAHGVLPVPAPAVTALLRGVPTSAVPEGGPDLGELTTPTGAALLAFFADDFGPAPAGAVAALGCGAGTREVPGRPNVLRAMLIEVAPEKEGTMDEERGQSGGLGEKSGVVRRIASGVAAGVRRSERKQDERQDVVPPEEATSGPVAEHPDAGERGPEAPEPDAFEAEPKAGAGGADAAEDAGPTFMDEAEATNAGEVAAEAPLETADRPAVDEPDTAGPATLDHVLLETNIDDMSAELLAHAADALREAGAVDVWMSQALMKKGRPGFVLHVLAAASERERLSAVLFAETSTFGVRVVPCGRLYAEERRESVKIGKLTIGVRLSFVEGRLATVSPEYEDVRRVAAAVGRPARVVYEAAQSAARTKFSGA
jgi:uncharacterized protein (DUF111 family)